MALKKYDFAKLRNWQTSKRSHQQEIEILNEDTASNTFIFFHGRWQGGALARRLAHALGSSCRFISIGPHGMNGEAIPSSFEQMALDRLGAIRSVQPHGPYHIGGHCNGALVAHEVARLLSEAGEQVATIVMIEPPTVNARRFMRLLHHSLSRSALGERRSERAEQRLVRFMALAWDCGEFFLTRRSLRRHFAVARKVVRERLVPFLKGHLALGRAGRNQKVADSGPYFDLEEKSNPLWRDYFKVAVVYLPQKTDVPTLVFTSHKNMHGERSFTFSGKVWRSINPKVEVVPLPGDHATSMTLGCGVIAARIRNAFPGQIVQLQDRSRGGSGAHEGPCVA